MANLTLSNQGVSLICNFESFRSKPYQDSGGLFTIGYGNRISNAEVEQWKDGISVEMARYLMSQSIYAICHQLVPVQLPDLMQHQQDALLSLTYNIGIETLLDSTVIKRIRAHDTDLSPWTWFIHDANKVTQPGLIARRQKELGLFVYGYF